MLPAAAVSGLYFAGAPSVYFAGATLNSHCSAPMLSSTVAHTHGHRMCRCCASSLHPQVSPPSSLIFICGLAHQGPGGALHTPDIAPSAD